MMSFAPLISIIIPVYNGSNYMREAIDSALAQTYKNYEIIVVNDGSCDDGKTLGIARSYGDLIRLIDKPNGGVASALNAGIEAMHGSYFSWLSHDDVYPENKLQIQVDTLECLEDKNVLMFGDYLLINQNGERMGQVSTGHVDTKNMPFELYSSQCIHGCTLLVPKSAFEKVGNFRLDLPTTQDYDLWFRISQKFPFVYVPHVLAFSRQHAEQGSRTLSHKKEVVDYYVQNFKFFSPTWLDAHFGPDELKGRYMLLLKKFASGHMWGPFYSVFEQANAHLTFKNTGDRVWFWLKMLCFINTSSLSGVVRRMIPLSIKNLLRKNLNRKAGFLPSAEPSNLDFIKIYKKNIFGSNESRSGSGSTLEQTAYIREVLPGILRDLNVKSFLDVPCGDFNWMKLVDLSGIQYIGGDIVPDLVDKNNYAYASPERTFRALNIISDELPKVDAIFCRDCLVHMKFDHARQALQNFKSSGSTYLITTTFIDRSENEELYGIWRTLNLQKAPFNLPPPLKMINEKCTEGRMKYTDKSLGLWKLSDINI
jgi:glycosyltransferase involved in cell wall biosynthesis